MYILTAIMLKSSGKGTGSESAAFSQVFFFFRAVEVTETSIQGGIFQHSLSGNTSPHWTASVLNGTGE
jgi:hypothetical protein